MAMHRLNLHQIVRLREICRKWRQQVALRSRRLSGAAGSSRHSSAPSLYGVPPGHLAVYVGPERERFVIKTSLLAHPLFKALLKKTEAEVGFRYEGGLTIPCNISAFRSLLHLMQGKFKMQESVIASSALHSQIEHYDRRPDDLCESSRRELQLLLQELHCLHLRDGSSRPTIRCVPLNPVADARSQEPIYG